MTVWLIVFGFISGILGGMGMGGGTLLIPLLNRYRTADNSGNQPYQLFAHGVRSARTAFQKQAGKAPPYPVYDSSRLRVLYSGRAAYQKHVFRGIENLLRRVYAPAGRVAVDFVRKTDGKGKKDRQGKVAFFRYGKLSFKPPTRAGALSTSRMCIPGQARCSVGRTEVKKSAKKAF